jgi:polyisoprenoid-binding protein YceI
MNRQDRNAPNDEKETSSMLKTATHSLKPLAPTLALALAFPLAAFAARPAEAAPETFILDKPHADVIFNISHLGYSKTWGRFRDLDATLVLDQENPAASSIEVTIDAVSIDTNYLKRDNHLRTPDFLSVREFPSITFKSTKIEQTGENTAKVTGDFTMHGVTKPITLDVTMNKLAEHPAAQVPAVGFSAQFVLDRSEFGVSTYAPAIGKDMQVFIDLEFLQRK